MNVVKESLGNLIHRNWFLLLVFLMFDVELVLSRVRQNRSNGG